ncbi:shikimate dehydrogenase [Jannaschia sp. CCS1]|uniref:Shikimate dehydrogenase (NADP(+)) n=1 Tax=Jannaschia sp. (strain CCS1) TaxID=290400 RepID=AROE_JANSC|nr:shikimate dehydrogenase [Jannaschia sp. CCS1]Q28VZ9.1 RecName: Full=Shikimate dehydrogenase (NADP(+)); Short=SDH [Jannaschia sp. CCS1]ABD53113.1 shikimate dehydrogenase [Jannaschia sp. CCS1]
MTRDTIPLAGVIGDPISHSLSPRLHGHWLRRYGLQGHYVPLHVNHANLETVLRTLPLMGFVGVNVTLPHKEHVLSIADSVTDRAALIGAANTLTFTANEQIQADNTDGMGFLSNIRQALPGWSASAGPALVLGSGGAAKAIVSALVSDGAPVVHVANRTRARADGLKEQFGARVSPSDWTHIPDLIGDAALIVNTTSLGMAGQSPLSLDLSRLSPPTVVTDIVYAPLQTNLLRDASIRGCETVDGLGMLLHQAVPGFERWFNYTPTVDEDLREAVLAG